MNRDRMIVRNALVAKANRAARIGVAVTIILGFWAWIFGNAWTDPDHPDPARWRLPKTTRVPGGRDSR